MAVVLSALCRCVEFDMVKWLVMNNIDIDVNIYIYYLCLVFLKGNSGSLGGKVVNRGALVLIRFFPYNTRFFLPNPVDVVYVLNSLVSYYILIC